MIIYVIEIWTGNWWVIEGSAFRDFKVACEYVKEKSHFRKVKVVLEQRSK